MIRACSNEDFKHILSIINDAAQAYKGVIPADRWKEPYMPEQELRSQIYEGVKFWGWEEEGLLLGVMGLQDKGDVILVRHAYVRTQARNTGIGGKLLAYLYKLADKPVLIGTWAAAVWAVGFYEKHGFKKVGPQAKDALLAKYWDIPARQVETSVVLADKAWFRQSAPQATNGELF